MEATNEAFQDYEDNCNLAPEDDACPWCGRVWELTPDGPAHASRTHTEACPYWAWIQNEGQHDRDDEWDPPDTETCPEHGIQSVSAYEVTTGPDPYALTRLKCGCRVICMGPGEPNVRI